MIDWLIVLAAAGAVVLVRGRFWLYARCRVCQGRKGRGAGSTDRAYSRCHHCGGSGERIRPTARLWKRWRDEAKEQS
jgi:hypothetical protein